MAHLTVRVPQALIQQLRRVADARGLDRSQVVRDALARHVAELVEPGKPELRATLPEARPAASQVKTTPKTTPTPSQPAAAEPKLEAKLEAKPEAKTEAKPPGRHPLDAISGPISQVPEPEPDPEPDPEPPDPVLELTRLRRQVLGEPESGSAPAFDTDHDLGDHDLGDLEIADADTCPHPPEQLSPISADRYLCQACATFVPA